MRRFHCNRTKNLLGLEIDHDRKSHWGLLEIPRGCVALTGVTRDSDAVGRVVQEEAV